jgi:arylsulfatase A-like enzyme
VDRLACHTDLMATFADLLGADLPGGAGEDSISFADILGAGHNSSPRREGIIHHSYTGMFAYRSGPWKWIDGVGGGRHRGTGKHNLPFDIFLYDREAVPEVDPSTGAILPWSFGPQFPEPEPGEPPGQLYHLANDPGESENLWREQPERVRELREALARARNQSLE